MSSWFPESRPMAVWRRVVSDGRPVVERAFVSGVLVLVLGALAGPLLSAPGLVGALALPVAVLFGLPGVIGFAAGTAALDGLSGLFLSAAVTLVADGLLVGLCWLLWGGREVPDPRNAAAVGRAALVAAVALLAAVGVRALAGSLLGTVPFAAVAVTRLTRHAVPVVALGPLLLVVAGRLLETVPAASPRGRPADARTLALGLVLGGWLVAASLLGLLHEDYVAIPGLDSGVLLSKLPGPLETPVLLVVGPLFPALQALGALFVALLAAALLRGRTDDAGGDPP